jgi:transcriptional regulator GlxA family with amidase domain
MLQIARPTTVEVIPSRPKPKTVLLALTDTHHGFYVGAARYARALRYIWDHFANSTLSVADVAAAVGVNRRVLEKAFREELAHGINEELIRTRLRAVARRLESGNESITDIASQTGYTRANHLFRTFRSHFGTSPRQYRENSRSGK